jgi:hypothetical protein
MSSASATGFVAQVIELRQYTLHPGQREVLIELFEREFVEPQQALGMQVLGTFRDLDRPERFVWLRGFADMAARAEALAAFYGGPVWQAHRAAANATMIDSDDVLLLRPAGAEAALRFDAQAQAHQAHAGSAPGLFIATVCSIADGDTAAFAAWFDAALRPALAAAGENIVAEFVTEPASNNFPRLPVREGERAFVWLSCFADEQAHRRHAAALRAAPAWRSELGPALLRRLREAPQVLRLAPTSRSALHA